MNHALRRLGIGHGVAHRSVRTRHENTDRRATLRSGGDRVSCRCFYVRSMFSKLALD